MFDSINMFTNDIILYDIVSDGNLEFFLLHLLQFFQNYLPGMLNIGDKYWYGINLSKKIKTEPLGSQKNQLSDKSQNSHH